MMCFTRLANPKTTVIMYGLHVSKQTSCINILGMFVYTCRCWDGYFCYSVERQMLVGEQYKGHNVLEEGERSDKETRKTKYQMYDRVFE